ncbi:hypothetical protein [Chryseobacterium viscerum]|nr:hypothetical protein [Chryseobacterium viscerum]MCW1960743.1 hypothetical protein [Chryseobacterium viscerum]WPO91745.1 hypothetical protein SFA27_03465 [Chryseobacterium sp. HR92]
MDTGAGSVGKLTIMDIDSKEIWQSDFLSTLYGDIPDFSKKTITEAL